MSEKTLKFANVRVDKKEFHISKQPIDLDLVNVDQIVVSDKFKHSDGFNFFKNWDPLHERLNSHYKAWSYKKRSTKDHRSKESILLAENYRV